MPQWIGMGLGRAGGMCPGRQGHGQCHPGSAVYSVLHGFFSAVSLDWEYIISAHFQCMTTPLLFLFCCVHEHRQYYSSCKSGNMDSALSIWFLLLWLGGDSCNLVGSFLADQLPLQVSDSYLGQSILLKWFQ